MTWSFFTLAESAVKTGYWKLLAFRQAQVAGLKILDSVVLLSDLAPGMSSGGSDCVIKEPFEPQMPRICSLGDSLVLRSVNPERFAFGPIFVESSQFNTTLTDLIARFPKLNAILIQPEWSCSKSRCRYVTIASRRISPNEHKNIAYQMGVDGAFSVFDSSDASWTILVNAYRSLEKGVGYCVRATFGLDEEDLTLLSVCRGRIPLNEYAEAAINFAEENFQQRGKALAVLAGVMDSREERFRVSEGDDLVLIQGRSLGNSWATGRLAFSPDTQVGILNQGDDAIMIRPCLCAKDYEVMQCAAGIVSLNDGVSSHFALLANSLDIPCIVDITQPTLHIETTQLRIGNSAVKDGDWVTIDEATGAMYLGRAERLRENYRIPLHVLDWANKRRNVSLQVNCEEPDSAKHASVLGADGIGLCRSERQLLSSREGTDAFRRLVTFRDKAIQRESAEVVCNVLGTSLKKLLIAINGKQINYRLLDPSDKDFAFCRPDNTELARQASLEECPDLGSVSFERGGGFRSTYSELYEGQIKISIATAIAVVTEHFLPVDLVCVVPMVSDLTEYIRWENFIRRQVEALNMDDYPTLSIRVGMMIETPRAALLVKDFLDYTDVLLVGTNDLTTNVWGLDRVCAHSWLSQSVNPFLRFDKEGVGKLVKSVTENVHHKDFSTMVTVCGSHASIAEDVEALVNTGIDGLSCSEEAFQRISLELANLSEREMGHFHKGMPQSSTSEKAFQQTLNQAMQAQDKLYSFALLEQWAKDVSILVSIEWTGVWKFFKRDLAAVWFGKREHRRFMPGWCVDDVLDYAFSISKDTDNLIRYSVFPPDIACHASSHLLPTPPSSDTWRQDIRSLDQRIPIEVFPQQPSDRIAFRAVLKSMKLSVEGALGQAIDIFWKDPQKLMSFTYDGWTQHIDRQRHNESFVRFFEAHVDVLFIHLLSICDFIGADWISVEGYAGPSETDKLFIADLDFPLDNVLIRKSTELPPQLCE